MVSSWPLQLRLFITSRTDPNGAPPAKKATQATGSNKPKFPDVGTISVLNQVCVPQDEIVRLLRAMLKGKVGEAAETMAIEVHGPDGWKQLDDNALRFSTRGA